MASKTIKVSEENYVWLLKIAAELQIKNKKPVSFDETLHILRTGKMEKGKLSELAGSWKISDIEAEKLKKNLRKGWGKWQIPSV